jgi:type I restriction enzyme S subunit
VKLKPYPAYRDSGVPWLGPVPEHWEVRNLRNVLKGVTERNRPDLPLLSVVRARGVILRNVTNRDENHNFIPDDLTNYKVVRKGQFVLNKMKAWQGSYGVSQQDGTVSPAYFTFDIDGADGAYLHSVIRSKAYVPFFMQASDGVRIDQWDLSQARMKEIPFLIPPLSEQAAIVRFLDYMDRRIRSYIRTKQKLIKLLEEQKQAIIHRAVTRSFDPNVRLKPSSVEWLCDVPEHWGLVQLRRLVSFVTSGSRGWANFYSETGDIFLQSGNLGRSMSLNLSFIQHVQPPQGLEGERTRVQRDDVLVCITGALTGNVAHVNMDLPATAFVNQHVALVRPNQAIVYPRYLAFGLHSEIGRTQFKAWEYGGTKQGLGLDDI